MLRHLSIKNYALIDSLEIGFEEGFSAITGETGAGKSIILGALGLILGQRAELQAIKDAEKKCVIEGVFEAPGLNLENFFSSNELDHGPQVILRREISLSGSSRAFINDTPVNLNQLKELGGMLLDIHSQHQNLLLTEGKFQMEVLDAVAGNEKPLKEYKEKFKNWQTKQQVLNELVQKEKENRSKQDYLQFQFDELSKANLKAGETAGLEEQLAILEHAEEIKFSLSAAHNLVVEGESNAMTLLRQARQQLSQALKYSPDLESLHQRLESTIIELADLAGELGKVNDGIVHHPEKTSLIRERLDFLNHLLQKHFLKTDAELLALMENIEKELMEMGSLEGEIKSLGLELKEMESGLWTLAKTIGEARRKAAPKFENIKKQEIINN